MSLKVMEGGLARRTLGLLLILATVFLWTASNFLASTIFADDSFSKPYFVTYFNTATFCSFLLIQFLGQPIKKYLFRTRSLHKVSAVEAAESDEADPFLSNDGRDTRPKSPQPPVLSGDPGSERISRSSSSTRRTDVQKPPPLNLRETFRLSLEFCILWFLANFFQSKGLEYTTVASATILMSTSGIWTLIFGSVFRVETFTTKKLLGVLASLGGVVMVSSVDWSGETDEHRGTFPHKTSAEIAVGDILALASAVFYGIYTVLIKRRIGDESRINMFLFLGFVGLLNTIILWPGFLILHFAGIEKFELPPTSRIWGIVLVNALISIISDICWAWAVLFSTPLVVTVGLSLSIPLSMIGQMIINSQTSSITYWLGAFTVFIAFIFVNSEAQEGSHEAEDRRDD